MSALPQPPIGVAECHTVAPQCPLWQHSLGEIRYTRLTSGAIPMSSPSLRPHRRGLQGSWWREADVSFCYGCSIPRTKHSGNRTMKETHKTISPILVCNLVFPPSPWENEFWWLFLRLTYWAHVLNHMHKLQQREQSTQKKKDLQETFENQDSFVPH